jgi:hypothetical protein
MSFNEYEFNKLELFVNYLRDSKKNSETFVDSLYTNVMSLFRLKYFEFIPKDTTLRSKEIFKLAMDLKCIEKSYNLKSYILGTNFLYFALLLDKRRKIFSFKMVQILVFTNLVILGQQYYFYNKIFSAFDPIVAKDLISLYQNLKREKEGFDKNVKYLIIIISLLMRSVRLKVN